MSDKLPNRWNINQINISSLLNDTIRILLKTLKTVTPPPFYMHQLVTCHLLLSEIFDLIMEVVSVYRLLIVRTCELTVSNGQFVQCTLNNVLILISLAVMKLLVLILWYRGHQYRERFDCRNMPVSIIDPFHNMSAPVRLRLPVPHVSTKPLKSSLSLHAKILFYIWNERITYCNRYYYEVIDLCYM